MTKPPAERFPRPASAEITSVTRRVLCHHHHIVKLFMAASTHRLLKAALPLVRTHGFSREALARSVLELPPSEAHAQPLSDSAVSALFGEGDDARRTLINGWLVEGVRHMQTAESPTLNAVLRKRLEYNEPVLNHLPEAFALLATSGFHVLDPRPALEHASRIADEACYAIGDESLHLSWYSKRASIAAVYSAAELHQLVSPNTAYSFLDDLIQKSTSVSKALDDTSQFSSYVFRSWKGIINSSVSTIIIMSSLPSPITNGASITNLPWTPNIGFSHSVLLNVPIAQVYPVLGTDEGHERAGRLNPLCTLFEMGEVDTVVIPSADDSTERQGTVERDVCWLDATTPATNPGGPFYSIYETVAEGSIGIKIWKVRKLEEVVEGEPPVSKTRVTEELKGSAPLLLAGVSQKKGAKAHREQMELFHTLFDRALFATVLR
ncbi:hypothetical protein BKA70DRAFT_1397390 [Coprinopsis sp. MPI-PUGE-AT-0042]|nr:hypothetical protein BKA70DRAFT_1397390 [Coprinopsis sp. MPI-PUGE-AT-0042]